MIRRRNYDTNKEQREDLLHSLKLFGTLVLTGLILATYGFFADKPDSKTGCVGGGILWAVFWAVPFGVSWLQLRRSKMQ